MLFEVVSVRRRCAALISILTVIVSTLFPNSGFGVSSVTIAWHPSVDPDVVAYNIYYGAASGSYSNVLAVGSATNATIPNLTPGTTYYMVATAVDFMGLESAFSNEAVYTNGATPPPNQAPTLAALPNITINENGGTQTVSLSGITSGATNEAQTLTITTVSSNPGLVPNPPVSYSSPASTGSLTFTPAPNGYGTATVTVTVNDGGASNNILTQSFTVTVNPVNQPPTLNSLANLAINENAGLQTINLSGITPGATNEVQNLTVATASSSPGLIPNPTVTYNSPSSTGSLSFTPVFNAYGAATVTVTMNDGGASNNILTQSFTVTVNPVNQPPTLNSLPNFAINENAGPQTVNLSGISSGANNEVQILSVIAASSNPGLIPDPAVSYTSPASTGSLTLTPAPTASGTATITVTVNDGGASNNTVTRSFTATVKPVNQPPTLNSLANLAINENAGLQTINLSGISSGASNEIQALRVTASSSSPGLIPNPTVSYTSPASTGSLSFTPVPNAYGTATITAAVNDGGTSNNILTRSFMVVVNQPPMISAIASQVIAVDMRTQAIPFVISDAESSVDSLSLTGFSSNAALVQNAAIVFGGNSTNRTVTVTPVAGQTGDANITVTVGDGLATNSTTFRLSVELKPAPPEDLRVVGP